MKTLKPLYALVSLSGAGKDSILQAAKLIAGERVALPKRYTSRPLRPGDLYLSATEEQFRAWEAKGELLGEIVSVYGNLYAARRDDYEQELAMRPIITHTTLTTALDDRKLGYTIRLSRLLVVNQRDEQILERTKDRVIADLVRMREFESKAFDGPDITNDFSEDQPTQLIDSFGQPIPAGAVFAARYWLTYIAIQENWDTSFFSRP